MAAWSVRRRREEMSEVLVGDHAGKLLGAECDTRLLGLLLIFGPHPPQRLVQRIAKLQGCAQRGAPIGAASENSLSDRCHQLILVRRESSDGAQDIVFEQDEQWAASVTTTCCRG